VGAYRHGVRWVRDVPCEPARRPADPTPRQQDGRGAELLRLQGAAGNRPNLDVGDHGPGVSLLQRKLTEVGYPVPVTGTFDATTHGAAVRFQANRPRLHPATGGVGRGG
jgi:peptidoglycan hydrolase-like protein with peptidoglycan-binding domain